MHCQKETCRKITDQQGDYVFGLKENHRLLYDDIKLFLSDNTNNSSVETFRTIEKNAGRIEERICRKITDVSWLEEREAWPGLGS
jgi:predicted transposase YbfD/YdcC